jgi:uncharacterized protein (DUF2141 family)
VLRTKAWWGLLVLSGTVPAWAADLTVEISGVTADKGMVYVALYDHEEDFPASGKQKVGKVVAPTGKQVSVVFKDLPPGSYAAAVFQDFNGNGKLDKNAFGVPKEPYGFSNGARGHAGPPTFAKAAVRVDENATMAITLK